MKFNGKLRKKIDNKKKEAKKTVPDNFNESAEILSDENLNRVVGGAWFDKVPNILR